MWKGMGTSQHWAVCNRCWPLFLGTHPMDHRNTCTVSLWLKKDMSTLVEFHGSVFIFQGLWTSAWKSVWTNSWWFLFGRFIVFLFHWQMSISVFISVFDRGFSNVHRLVGIHGYTVKVCWGNKKGLICSQMLEGGYFKLSQASEFFCHGAVLETQNLMECQFSHHGRNAHRFGEMFTGC